MAAVKSYPAVLGAFAFEQLTVSTVSLALTAATYAPAGFPPAGEARILVEAQPIRVRYDGGAPTAAIGHLVAAGTEFIVRGSRNIANLRMIRSGGVDATATVTYSR